MKPNRDDTASQRKRNEDALFQAVDGLQGTQECRNFFKDLCTPAELQALVDRWQVVGLLRQELPLSPNPRYDWRERHDDRPRCPILE